MGLPGYQQLKGVPPELMGGGGLPQNAVPPNSAMSVASILGGVPPELLGQGPPNLGLPPFKPGLGHLYKPPNELIAPPLGYGRNGGYPLAGVRG